VQIAVLTVADSRVEYLVDTGLSDPAVRDYLNNQLLDFFAWPTYDAENSDKVVETTASFSIIGGRYLNVKSSDYESVPGAAYPTANVRAATFDLTTGDGVAPFGGIFTVDEAFLSAIRGALTLVEPEADIPDAADVLADALGDPAQQADVQIIDDYTFAIYLGGRLHAEGDFWKFLGDTADFAPFFTPAFADAFAGRVL
ncbi:MAG: hypothetical protein LBT36_04815, partial [Oscillospiraceae bacterium]|jgi:hypothetical protein|nr:hypothetical protein [Oscillospiraceae bacterium]